MKLMGKFNLELAAFKAFYFKINLASSILFSLFFLLKLDFRLYYDDKSYFDNFFLFVDALIFDDYSCYDVLLLLDLELMDDARDEFLEHLLLQTDFRDSSKSNSDIFEPEFFLLILKGDVFPVTGRVNGPKSLNMGFL